MVWFEILLLNLYGERRGDCPLGQVPVSAIMTEVVHDLPQSCCQRPGWWTGPPPLHLTFFNIIIHGSSYHLTLHCLSHWHQHLISCKYSKTLLNQLALDWTCAELSNIPDDQMVLILTSVLKNNSLLLLLYFGCTVQLIGGVFHWDTSFICWFSVIRVLICVLWCLRCWKSWWNRR
jgi:hypothetical protein